MTPRSWVTKITAMPSSLLQRAQQVEDLRLHGDVERGRGLVGDEQARVADERHRDHHALAHAARELVRVLAEPALGVGDADEVEQLDARVPRARHLLIFAVEADRARPAGCRR